MRTMLALAVLVLAACEPPPALETSSAYAISADGLTLTCSGAAQEFDFTTDGTSYHSCSWKCAAYHGAEARLVDLLFARSTTGWQFVDASLNPLDANGAPVGCR